jgi:succinate dehydrogenase/fumarate reductase flavoprotein subunit
VYCVLDRAPQDIWAALRRAQPNFFLPFDRAQIDPFTQRFPVTLRLEGTVRGTGGLRVVDERCATTVPGLYAAGDASTRELICGGFTGGGSHNAAWAISSGTWAGRGAAMFARAGGHEAGTPAGRAGLRPAAGADAGLDADELVRAVQAEVQPYDKNYFRTADMLAASRTALEDLWATARNGLGGPGYTAVRSREAVAMIAHARWMYAAAAARPETRGMHKRLDRPQLDPALQHRVLAGGLDEVWTGVDPVAPAPLTRPEAVAA